ncbi:hypothetical protein M432DRAFT_368130 [Thermoascus aurantiacus ATCC 26904]
MINDMNINITFLTPTVAVKFDPRVVEDCLQTVCIGGEPLSKDLLRKCAGSKTKLVNQYGMGEGAICCAFNNRIYLGSTANISHPSSSAIWVTDPSNPDKLMLISAVGELLIEGPHLSCHYLDNAAWYTEVVLLDAAPVGMNELHPERCSAQFYHSSDLGRLNADSMLDYIGRKDTILKLDGCRVDAAEIEHQARQCLGPNDAIMVDLLGAIDRKEDPVLGAYLYLDDKPASTLPSKGEPKFLNTKDDPYASQKVEVIKECIDQVMPKYEIPQVFLPVSWMLWTASNKMDRKKLHVVGNNYYMQQRSKRTQCRPKILESVLLLPLSA